MSLIDEALQRREENRRVRSPNPRTLYVTDLTKPCSRSAYFDIVLDKSHGVDTLRIFEAGRVLEDYWLKVLGEREDVYIMGTQIPVYLVCDDYEIHGRVDVLCQHNKNVLVAHEVKTARTCHWMKEAKPEHVQQLQFYLNRLGINHGQIDYLDKTSLLTGDNPIDKSFEVWANSNIYEDLLVRAHELVKAWEEEKPSVPNPKAWGGRICDYCLYQDECQEEGP